VSTFSGELHAYVAEEAVFPLDSPEVIAKIVEEHMKESKG